MAKSEVSSPKLLTFNKAQKYLSDNGHTVSTQQVRHLARTNPIVSAAVVEYVDPVTDASAKVISQSALDEYLTWRVANPEGMGRGGNRRVAGPKPAHILVDAAQLEAMNAVLTANGFNEAAFPVRKPRKVKVAVSDNGSNPLDGVSSDVDLSELELIDIA